MLGYADYVFTTVFTIEIILKVNLLTNQGPLFCLSVCEASPWSVKHLHKI